MAAAAAAAPGAADAVRRPPDRPEIHGSNRSHIYLGIDVKTDMPVAIKIPSIDLRDDPAYLKRFVIEEWIALRIDSPHVLKPRSQSRRRNYLYVMTEFVEGQTLTQWMIDHPRPDLETVRGIADQIAKELRAFHRKEMLHQDLRPDNVMIDKTNTSGLTQRSDASCIPIRTGATRAFRNSPSIFASPTPTISAPR